jgi:hypothetical protein
VPLRVHFPAGFALEYTVVAGDSSGTATEVVAMAARRTGLPAPHLLALYASYDSTSTCSPATAASFVFFFCVCACVHNAFCVV